LLPAPGLALQGLVQTPWLQVLKDLSVNNRDTTTKDFKAKPAKENAKESTA
jgi:hypothetical protein